MAYLNLAGALDSVETRFEEGRMALDMLRRALGEPARQIVANAGEDASVVLRAVEDAIPASLDRFCFLLRRVAKLCAATEKGISGAPKPPPSLHQCGWLPDSDKRARGSVPRQGYNGAGQPSRVNSNTQQFGGATAMNKRDTVLDLIHSPAPPAYVPAAFFMHFDPAFHQGQAAIDQHLAFFRATGMDFVKIQYEQSPPPAAPISTPADWRHAPRCDEDFFAASIRVAEGLVKAAKGEALVIMTLYSPFMWAAQLAGAEVLAEQLRENPDAVRVGLEIMTENVLTLARGCRRVGVDGFYVSSQGGEAFRFPGTEIFRQYIRPTDLAVWDEVQPCAFNILHICDYAGPYADLTPFLDYPGHVVNCSLKLGDRTMRPADVARMFGRPFMGGLERLGVIATGDRGAIRQAAEGALAEAPDRFILAADCTIPSSTPWEHVKIAIDTAHQYRN